VLVWKNLEIDYEPPYLQLAIVQQYLLAELRQLRQQDRDQDLE
jgi:hypothetical protein